MDSIDFKRLLLEAETLKKSFQRQSPFHYIVIDNFLHNDQAEKILHEYPSVNKKTWVDANGLHQLKKWAQPCVEGSVAANFYNEVNSSEFLAWMEKLTGTKNLLADHKLEGAGYHQILDGGFLNVHIDFNRHNGLERRLNLLVYLNKDWQEEYGGYLELWDMKVKKRIEHIAPIFNRCVIFETNEVSYHGHPVPLKTGGVTTRKSLSVYYYTKGRDDIAAAPTHNTLYINTRGIKGSVAIAQSSIQHLGRKIKKIFSEKQ